MNENSNRQSHPELDESLEVAVWAVVSEPLPANAVDRVKQRAKKTLVNEKADLERSIARPPHGRFQFSPTLKLALAASVLAAILAGGSYFGFSFGETSVYAQAAKRLGSIRSMVCYVQFSSTSQPEDFGQSFSRQKVMYLAPSFHRVEDKELNTIQIVDRERQRTLLLNMDSKEAIEIEGETAAALDAHSPAKIVEALMKHVQIDRADNDSVTKIANTTVEGVVLEGYESVMGTEIVRVWFDPYSFAPVIVAVRFELPGALATGGPARLWQVLSEIELDTEMDRKLFSSDVPDGFSTLAMGDLSVDPTPPTLDDVIKMLRLCAENNEKEFPTSLSINDTVGTPLSIQSSFADRLQNQIDSGTEKMREQAIDEIKQFGATLGRATAFLLSMKDENDWNYFGGAKLNQTDRPLLWYSPDGNQQYKVVYSNLTVRDSNLDALPNPPRDIPAPLANQNVIRVSTPRFSLPRNTVREFAKLQEIRTSGRQTNVEYLQLAMMPELLESQVKRQPGDEIVMQAVDPSWKPNRDATESRLSFLKEFKNLKGLDVGYLYLTQGDLSVIGTCRQLERLSLNGIYLFDTGSSRRLVGDDLANLSNLKSLQLLDLSQSNYSSGMIHLKDLPNLHTLYLSSFEHLNNATLGELTVLPRLKTLVFAPVYGSNPKTTVTEPGLEAFKRMPGLETLFVGYHGKWTLPIEQLRKMLPDVDVRSPTE